MYQLCGLFPNYFNKGKTIDEDTLIDFDSRMKNIP